jgi:histidyl-tRNA synthetase
MFLGATKNLGKQLAYADRRNAPAVVIEGGDERARGVVQVKDLAAGKAASATIADNAEWKAERPGQFECPNGELVARIAEIVTARTGTGRP